MGVAGHRVWGKWFSASGWWNMTLGQQRTLPVAQFSSLANNNVSYVISAGLKVRNNTHGVCGLEREHVSLPLESSL